MSFSLVAGACCLVNFSNSISSTPTLNINSTGAKSLRVYNRTNWYIKYEHGDKDYYSAASGSGIFVVYDGTSYHVQDVTTRVQYSD